MSAEYPRILIVLVLLSGCSQTGTTGSGDSGKKSEATIKTDFPKKKDLRRVIEQPASIDPFEETPLVARIPGYVVKVPADIGKHVVGPKYDKSGNLTTPGEVLAELSVPELLQELEQKRGLVKQAKAEVDQALASVDAADAAILTAKALVKENESSRGRALASYEYWKTQYKRFTEAAEKGLVEKQVKEETLNKYKAAEAYRDEIEAKVQSAMATAKESEAKRNKAKADVEAAKARVLVAQADEGRLAALTEYRFIRAPFDGVVVKRNIHTGHFIKPDTGVGSQGVFIVARTDLLRISADIPEAEAQYIKKDMAATIQPPAYKELTFEGKVARTSETLDARSRTLRVEVDYVNKDGKLRPGTFANLLITAKFDGRWTLPKSATFVYADQPCCWRVEDGKAVRTQLKLGVRDGNDLEVFKMQQRDGSWAEVTGKEEVVVAGLGGVTEGKEIPRAK